MSCKLRRKNRIKENSNFSVDRIEDDYVILVNNDTGRVIEVKLDFTVKEGDILTFKNNKYQINEAEYNKRQEEILEKLNKVKRG